MTSTSMSTAVWLTTWTADSKRGVLSKANGASVHEREGRERSRDSATRRRDIRARLSQYVDRVCLCLINGRIASTSGYIEVQVKGDPFTVGTLEGRHEAQMASDARTLNLPR